MVTYNTRQKKLVLELIESNSDTQFTCEAITELLSRKGTPVGKTTVYRQLEKLSKDGIIKKIYADSSKSYIYQHIDGSLRCDEHMHLRCRECGKYIHLGCEFMNKVNEHVSLHHDFIIDNSCTELVGVCGNCSAERMKGDSYAADKL